MKRLIVMSVFVMIILLSAALMAQRGAPPVPPATGPMLEVANKIAEAINKQDAAALQKMLAPDAVYLDEDGHAPPPMAWINRLTMGSPAKQIMITQTHGQTWDNSGWVSFNYSLSENYQGQPKTLRGTASIVLKKAATGDWQITLVHGALEQKVPNLTN